MVVTRGGFSGVVANGFAGIGFPAEAPSVFEFPIEMFLPDSDLTPINENIDKIVYGLTKWEPEIKEKGVVAPPKVTVEGKDYEEAVANMNHLFLKNMWADGLPLLPATEERVSWILQGTPLPRDEVVGKILPRGGIATVESIAVALAMAGGRPEYLPVLIAAVEAMIEPEFKHEAMNATTNSVYPAVMVNGPIAKQIRLNSGYGCLGPDPVHPAGGSIGRAIRIMLQDMGGAIPGTGTMAIFGGPARYNNIVFAEDEGGLPSDWKSLSVDQGFPEGSNVVTVQGVASTVNGNGTSVGDEASALTALNMIAGYMRTPNQNYFIGYGGSPGIVLMGRGTAQALAEFGWSKEKIKDYLWENSILSWSEVEGTTSSDRLEARLRNLEGVLAKGESWPISPKPEDITLVVAGGAQSGHGYWMECGHGGYVPVSKETSLPANWDELLKQAEEDLGPLPAD
jgi:hypothetical protein